MKSIKLFALTVLFSSALTAQEFKFEKEVINYGKVAKDSEGTRTFKFTNIGDQPLIIKNIQSTCDCTVPEKPEHPIMPGDNAEITVFYDTKKPGRFSKEIIIFSNAKNARKVIKIKGFVTKG